MRITGLEEHFVTSEVLEAWRALDPRWCDDPSLRVASMERYAGPLIELGTPRVAAMDESGLDVQVLSLTPPGLQILDRADAVALQSDTNDRLAEAVKAHPERLQGFAALATQSPEAAADELERAVRTLGLNGAMLLARTREGSLDRADCWPIFERAQALNAPLYLHPQSPPRSVRDAYYDVDDELLSTALTLFGVGWHFDTGMQLLRLIVNGVFDQFPELQVIVGHWGEVVLFYLERIEEITPFTKLDRPLADYFRQNVFYTPSGMYSERYLRWTIETVGVERVLFSTDYPFVPAPQGVAPGFLEGAAVSQVDREGIASGNWDRLVAGIRR
ncbi:amidohydrolase family protein [Streptomyces sp. B21-083]|uniref:amidohydrolase family protein n=1 Tax=Streptomyces sp. B21-083 TaxID=3039410 RepID=UPI002FEFD4D0